MGGVWYGKSFILGTTFLVLEVRSEADERLDNE
jgi:hypothetical protein